MKNRMVLSLLLLTALVLASQPAVACAENSTDLDTPDSAPSHHHMMSALLGDYLHTRESSGTAWQPDSTPMQGWHWKQGEWSFMAHGIATGIYNNQGGKRGDEKGYVTDMAMLMASRPLGEGTLGLKSMLSLEPLMGKSGYPELLQSGETANGQSELIDRQHPHDLFMELAATYSFNIAPHSSVFIYGALPGEPALGPPAFMHRPSGEEIPDAPITHHWLDSSHVTEGVLTLGLVVRDVKFEGSIFNGREPDQERYNIETRPLDSHAFRVSYNFDQNWSGQISHGLLRSPEQLQPEVRTERMTASLTYNRAEFAVDGNWATTLAWGQNVNQPGRRLTGLLLESAFKYNERHTIFGRLEEVQKDELFEDGEPWAGKVFEVGKLAGGYIYDFQQAVPHLIFGIGGEASLAFLPSGLADAYGDAPVSVLLFVRGKIV